MVEEFNQSVDDGLKLLKRVDFSYNRRITAPRPHAAMTKSGNSNLPTSPIVYAVIYQPSIVDNPDIATYQPYVHGKCDPPALIPLQMNWIELEVDSYFDTVFVRMNGSWRVHCVKGSRSCDCRIAIPMGEQGSILGVEAEVHRKTYSTEIIKLEDETGMEKGLVAETNCYLNPHIFTFTIPKVDGGTTFSIKASWTQKVLYRNGEFSLKVPFSFPEYVNSHIKELIKREKIRVNVNLGPGNEILCKMTSHPLKQLKREVGKLGLLYEAEVLTWTNTDLLVSYTLSPSQISGGLLLQSPGLHDIDQREMFCMYLFPDVQENRKVFRKEIVFAIDMSRSMEGKRIEGTKIALSAALMNLHSEDSFNIIAFDEATALFSSSMELATKENIDKGIEWMSTTLMNGEGTNILLPLNQAIEMFSYDSRSLPIIILVTDGAVEDERNICDVMKGHLTASGSLCPRIHTFGIGSYCNHHFLRTLATMSRGKYDAAIDVDDVESRLQNLFNRAMTPLVANITLDTFDGPDKVEFYPSQIPDLSPENPLVAFGRYKGDFPTNIKAKGILGDSSKFSIDLKVLEAKDIPLDRMFAEQYIDLFTARAWLSEDKQLESKVVKLSLQAGIASEYTRMVLYEDEKENPATTSPSTQKLLQKTDVHKADIPSPKRISKWNLCRGFGDLKATADNLPRGVEQSKLPEGAGAAPDCCVRMCCCWRWCCCMCFIKCCTKMNNQCSIVMTQLCTGLACFGCFELCSDCCSACDGDDA